MVYRLYVIPIFLLTGALTFGGTANDSSLEIVLQAGHKSIVAAIAFTPDDDFLISFSDQQMKVWETASGLLIDNDDQWPTSAGGSVALSYDGALVATTRQAPHGIDITIVDRHSHAILHHLPDAGGASAMAFSKDNRYLAIGHTGRSPTITIWDTITNIVSLIPALGASEVTTPGNITYGIWALAFSPDGEQIACGRNDRLVVWNIPDRQQRINRQIVDRSTVTSLEFDNAFNILVGTEKGIYRLNLTSAALSKVGDDNTVFALRFDHKYAKLANGSANALNIRELQDDRVNRFGYNIGLHYGTAMSNDGSQWATVGVPDAKSVAVWDINSGRRTSVLFAGEPQIGAVFVHKNIVATSSFEAIRIWNLVGSTVVKRIPRTVGGWFGAMESCPKANLLMALDGGSTQELRIWRSRDESGLEWGNEEPPIKVPPMSRTIAVSPDCTRVAVTGGFTTFAVSVFDLTSRKEVPFEQIQDNRQFGYDSLAFSPDGALLAAASNRIGGILLWNAETGKALPALPALTSPFSEISFSSDSSILAYADHQGNLSAWEINTQRSLTSVRNSDQYTAVHFVPGKHVFVATGQNTFVTIWKAGDSTAAASVYTFPDKWLVLSSTALFDTNSFNNTTFLRWRVPGDRLHLYPVEVLLRDFYEPGLLRQVLNAKDLHQSRSVLLLNRVQPLVGVRAEWKDEAAGIATVWVKVQVNRDASMGNGKTFTKPYDLRLFRDGQLVGWAPKTSVEWQLEPPPTGPKADELDLARWREKTEIRDLGPDGSKEFPFPVQVPRRADLKQVVFTAYAFNEDRVKSATASATLTVDKPLRPRKGKAYLVTVGVNRTESSPAWDLHYAANDARQMSKVVGDSLQGTQQFSDVVRIRLVSDTPEGHEADEGAPTKVHLQAVLDVLAGRRNVDEQLKREIPGIERATKAEPEDLVLLSFSSHGYTDSRGIFHIVLEDIGKTTPQDQITAALQRNSLSSDVLSAWLRDVDAGEMTMIVDACHSEATVAAEGFKPGPMGSRGLGQLAYDKGMRILAASKSNEEAMELGGTIKQGLLSYALVEEGLVERKAAKDGKIVMSGWLTYGEQEVPNLYSAGKVKGPNGKKPTAANGRDIIYLGPDQVPSTYQQPVLFDFNKQHTDTLLSTQ